MDNHKFYAILLSILLVGDAILFAMVRGPEMTFFAITTALFLLIGLIGTILDDFGV